ncbi:organic cation transporter-like protein [Penaeus indicus]|uniref:organic cation transporter-like protein n=1 Tax=Penaeus indicus TaxID=29960 RepID=UPI00300CAED2
MEQAKSHEPEKNNTMDFEEINEALGPFGKYQKFVFFLSCWGSFMPAMVVVCMTFVGNNVDHRCFVPGCDDPNEPDFSAEFVNDTIPHGDECFMYQRYEPVTNSSTCNLDDFNVNVKTNCSEKVFDTSLFTSTTVTEFDLTCENAWLGPLAGSMYMVGMLLGAITIGDLADRFGRKMGILVSVMLLGGGGVLSAVSPNYYMFLAMRLLTGAGGVGLFQVTFVLAVEFIGAKYRTFCGIMIEVPFALGEAMTGVLAIFIREWRWLQVAVTAPAFLLLSYMWIMPESVRWLVSQGKRDVAVKIIKKAADVNGVEVPKHLLEDSNTEVGRPSHVLVSSSPDTEVSRPSGIKRMGRKGTLSFVLLLGGVACFVSGFIPEEFGAVIVTLSLVGKFGIAAAFAIVYVYSAEIFPTEYRSVGIGACSMCARIGGIVAPFVASLAHTYKPLPLLVFGSLSIVAGLLVVLLPETVGCELPQTIPESESFGSDQSIWYFSCCGKKRREPVTEENTATEDQRV